MPLTSPLLSALPGIRHAFFTREGGVSGGIYQSLNAGLGSNDAPENVAENRRRMAEAVGVATNGLISCYQVHSPDIIVATAPHDGTPRARADGVVTRTRGLACAAAHADCGPVLLADPKAGIVGAAHAGWKGALTGVTDTAIAQMEALGAARHNIVAVLGPCIRQPSYEVSEAFLTPFLEQSTDNKRFFAEGREGHAHFDLAGYILMRLKAAKIGTIGDMDADTCADEARFFSYRRTTLRKEADYGRHLSVITLT